MTCTRSFYSFMKTNSTSIMPFSPIPSVSLSPKRSQLSPQTRTLDLARSRRSPPYQFKIMPGIILNGTSPTFYKIPVSKNLVTAVQDGHYPKQETVVLAHRPAVVPSARRPCSDEGMNPLDNRRLIFSCFEAFKRFVN